MKAFHKETQGSLIGNFKILNLQVCYHKIKTVAGTNSGDLIRKQMVLP